MKRVDRGLSPQPEVFRLPSSSEQNIGTSPEGQCRGRRIQGHRARMAPHIHASERPVSPNYFRKSKLRERFVTRSKRVLAHLLSVIVKKIGRADTWLSKSNRKGMISHVKQAKVPKAQKIHPKSFFTPKQRSYYTGKIYCNGIPREEMRHYVEPRLIILKNDNNKLNPFGHAILQFGPPGGVVRRVHINALNWYPEHMNEREFEHYLEKNSNNKVAYEIKMDCPNVEAMWKKLDELSKNCWLWGGGHHNCLTFCQDIIEAGQKPLCLEDKRQQLMDVLKNKWAALLPACSILRPTLNNDVLQATAQFSGDQPEGLATKKEASAQKTNTRTPPSSVHGSESDTLAAQLTEIDVVAFLQGDFGVHELPEMSDKEKVVLHTKIKAYVDQLSSGHEILERVKTILVNRLMQEMSQKIVVPIACTAGACMRVWMYHMQKIIHQHEGVSEKQKVQWAHAMNHVLFENIMKPIINFEVEEIKVARLEAEDKKLEVKESKIAWTLDTRALNAACSSVAPAVSRAMSKTYAKEALPLFNVLETSGINCSEQIKMMHASKELIAAKKKLLSMPELPKAALASEDVSATMHLWKKELERIFCNEPNFFVFFDQLCHRVECHVKDQCHEQEVTTQDLANFLCEGCLSKLLEIRGVFSDRLTKESPTCWADKERAAEKIFYVLEQQERLPNDVECHHLANLVHLKQDLLCIDTEKFVAQWSAGDPSQWVLNSTKEHEFLNGFSQWILDQVKQRINASHLSLSLRRHLLTRCRKELVDEIRTQVMDVRRFVKGNSERLHFDLPAPVAYNTVHKKTVGPQMWRNFPIDEDGSL